MHGSWEYAAAEHLGQQGLGVPEGQQQDNEVQVSQALSGLAARILSKDRCEWISLWNGSVYILTPPTLLFPLYSHMAALNNVCRQ